MTLNNSKSIKTGCYIPTVCVKKEMHSRDTTVLIDYCDLMSCTTPACFSTFF